jgi:hypothetical protein
MSERTPPLARDLTGMDVRYTWKYGEGGAAGPDPAPAPESDVPQDPQEEVERLKALVRHLAGALEDVVALALSGADYRERAIMMHRRAVAALSGASLPPREPPPRKGDPNP